MVQVRVRSARRLAVVMSLPSQRHYDTLDEASSDGARAYQHSSPEQSGSGPLSPPSWLSRYVLCLSPPIPFPRSHFPSATAHELFAND